MSLNCVFSNFVSIIKSRILASLIVSFPELCWDFEWIKLNLQIVFAKINIFAVLMPSVQQCTSIKSLRKHFKRGSRTSKSGIYWSFLVAVYFFFRQTLFAGSDQRHAYFKRISQLRVNSKTCPVYFKKWMFPGSCCQYELSFGRYWT